MRAFLVTLALVAAGCGGSSATADGPDRDRFGYRVGSDPNRETMLLRPVSDSTRYLVYPAVVDSVAVRPAGRPLPGDGVAVEVLVQGALPDACAELTDVTQARQSHFVTVDLLMRQPRETVCAAVVRPFRFYLMLDGAYPAGSYTLRLNGAAVPFQVLPAPATSASGDAG
ncbi:hypothetical protein [Rubrivirga sp.]|uniref:hypothetical protein n=1 Tax=Rubrivirga sp. TaxID=1885344 RepID=UPI003B52E9E3